MRAKIRQVGNSGRYVKVERTSVTSVGKVAGLMVICELSEYRKLTGNLFVWHRNLTKSFAANSKNFWIEKLETLEFNLFLQDSNKVRFQN